MGQFDVHILGCGSATPSRRHNPSCQVIDFRGTLMMVDCGEGAQRSMLSAGLSFNRLRRIFISHMHGDHVLGLPGLLSTLALRGRQGEVDVWLPSSGLDIMSRMTAYFCGDTPYTIRLHPVDGPGELYADHALSVEAFRLYHRVECYGYIFREKPKPRHLDAEAARFFGVPVSRLVAIKQGEDFVTADGRVIANERLTRPADPSGVYAYASDTSFNPAVADAVSGATLLYHEATYTSDMSAQARERGHSTAAEAARIAAMAGAERLLIGHYSKRYHSTQPLLDEARKEFAATEAADEGLVIPVVMP